MVPVITRKRLIVAAAAALATAGVATGTVLATRSTAASPPASSTFAPSSQSPGATPGAGRHYGHGLFPHGLRHRVVLIGRVTAVSSSSISLANYQGTVATYSVSPKVRVVGPDRKPESLTSLPVGEIVIAVEVTRPGPAAGTPSATATPQTPGQAPGTPVVVLIRDTGFKAS